MKVEEHVQPWQVARDLTLQVADLMPEDGYGFKLAPQQMTFGELLNHLAWSSAAIVGMTIEGKIPFSRPEQHDRAGVRRLVESCFDYCIGAMRGLEEERFNQVVGPENRQLPVQLHIWRAYAHAVHHRGQAEVYLRAKGIEPPAYRF